MLILRELGVRSIRLMSNNPRKLAGVVGDGLHISERIPLEMTPSDSNRRYLQTKKEKLGHQLSEVVGSTGYGLQAHVWPLAFRLSAAAARAARYRTSTRRTTRTTAPRGRRDNRAHGGRMIGAMVPISTPICHTHTV